MPRRDGNARALRGRGISSALPAASNALVWNGSVWAPGAGGGGNIDWALCEPIWELVP